MTDSLLERLAYLSSGDTSFQKELIQIFLVELQKNSNKIDRELQAGNLSNAAQAAHAIKGAALNLGANPLGKASEALEYQLEKGHEDPELNQALKVAIKNASDKLRTYLVDLN